MAFYKQIVKWDPSSGATGYSDVLSRATLESATMCLGGHKTPFIGHACMVHSLVVDDHSADAGTNGRLLFGYWLDSGVYNVRSIDKATGAQPQRERTSTHSTSLPPRAYSYSSQPPPPGFKNDFV